MLGLFLHLYEGLSHVIFSMLKVESLSLDYRFLMLILLNHYMLKLSATNISRTDNLLKFCILLALVNVYPKQFKKYMVTMETIEIGRIIN